MIKVIVFDLGNVLYLFHFIRAMNFIGQFCPGMAHRVLSRMESLLLEYELGELTSEQFVRAVCDEIGFTGTLEQFREGFSDIFEENPDAINVAKRLKGEYPLYLLSNTNEMHIEHLIARFPAFAEFDGHVYSYEEGIAKPNPRIFRIAIKRFGLEPPATLFIDDRQENIEAASALGFRTIHYLVKDGKPRIRLQDELTKFGIEI